MPLSFASILGGTVTLIGTSTNLVVAGKQKEAFPGDQPIGLFALSPYGVPVALTGIIYIIIFAPQVLPGKAKKRRSEYDAASLNLLPQSRAYLSGIQCIQLSLLAMSFQG